MCIKLAVEKKINKLSPSAMISTKDFPSFNRDTVAKALSLLAKEGVLEKMGKGLYCKPQKNPWFGVQKAGFKEQFDFFLKSNYGDNYIFTGATLYNRLGFTTQNPSQWDVLTNKRPRTISILNQKLNLHYMAAPINARTRKVLTFLEIVKYSNKNFDSDIATVYSDLLERLESFSSLDFYHLQKNFEPNNHGSSTRKLYPQWVVSVVLSLINALIQSSQNHPKEDLIKAKSFLSQIPSYRIKPKTNSLYDYVNSKKT